MTEYRTHRSKRVRAHRWVTLETTSGGLLVLAAALALAWANSPWRSGYSALSGLQFGPSGLHLDLSLAAWATDGLLAIFFFVVGAELKTEFVSGHLRNFREAAVPMLAAVGGMVIPALVFVGVIVVSGDTAALHGWAIPTATDIAFALAILAIFGRGLPAALRTFLLTLAVVDDLLAIIIIAVFYTASVNLIAFLLALVVIAVFAVVARLRWARWWNLVPLALLAWALMHESGIHATIAGVLLGLVVPARYLHGEGSTRARRYEYVVKPWSSAFALPVFAFFSAGVSLVDGGGAASMFREPVVPAIVFGLVVGKIVGVLGTTALVTKLSRLRLPHGLSLRDLVPVGLLAGIGFTVSLLLAELSFPHSEYSAAAKLAVLTATAIAAILAALTLRWDSREHRTEAKAERQLRKNLRG
ncbi:MAG: Na+/H+ antiporter NhaA [Terrimesophilobacter sp.]